MYTVFVLCVLLSTLFHSANQLICPDSRSFLNVSKTTLWEHVGNAPEENCPLFVCVEPHTLPEGSPHGGLENSTTSILIGIDSVCSPFILVSCSTLQMQYLNEAKAKMRGASFFYLCRRATWSEWPGAQLFQAATSAWEGRTRLAS